MDLVGKKNNYELKVGLNQEKQKKIEIKHKKVLIITYYAWLQYSAHYNYWTLQNMNRSAPAFY